MSLLRRSSTLASLEKRSASIKDVFTRTVEECKQVNQEIQAVVSQKEEEIKALQSEVSSLTSIQSGNAKLAGKIEAFLNE